MQSLRIVLYLCLLQFAYCNQAQPATELEFQANNDAPTEDGNNLLAAVLEFQANDAPTEKNGNLQLKDQFRQQKEACEATSDGDTYFDVNRQRCILKISLKWYSAKLMENGTWTCPEHARRSRPWDKGSAYCRCDESYIHTLDRQQCAKSVSLEEACIIREDEFANSNPKHYGNSNCDYSKGLICKNGLCRCENSEAIWNSDDQQCYSAPDCRRLSGWSYYDSNTNACYHIIGQYSFGDGNKYLKCPLNSKKIDDNFYGSTCECFEGYPPSNDSLRCEAVITYDDSCSIEDGTLAFGMARCNYRTGLSCENSKCTCSNEYKWDGRLQDCRTPTGSYCWSKQRPCGKYARCSSSYCTCNTGYSLHKDVCYANHHTKCSEQDECLPELTCLDGRCQCKDPIDQIYINGTCKLRAGIPCLPGPSELFCVDSALCLNNKCVCNLNYLPTANGICLLDYGANCTSSSVTCNYEQGLICRNSTCNCTSKNLEYISGEGCVQISQGTLCGNIVENGERDSNGNRLDKYFVGCKSPLICAERFGGISRCLLPGESVQLWAKQNVEH